MRKFNQEKAELLKQLQQQISDAKQQKQNQVLNQRFKQATRMEVIEKQIKQMPNYVPDGNQVTQEDKY